jgi:ABC-type cobalamin/Fe3+-siderophores transport system ATPase subunit
MIELENVYVRYDKLNVISNVNISIPCNSFISLVGPNGSGKSTLLKSIAGLVPFSGDISYNGMSLKNISRKDRAKILAYLPQSRTIPDIEVGMMIEHGRFPHLSFTNKLQEKDIIAIESAIQLTNIKCLLGKKLNNLSGGERQRVFLAMAIAQDSNIFLLDEPTTYLDINYQLDIVKIILDLHKRGKTIIMVAHDLPQAFSFSQLICIVNKGFIYNYNTPDIVSKSSSIKDVFGINIELETHNPKAIYSYSLVKES